MAEQKKEVGGEIKHLSIETIHTEAERKKGQEKNHELEFCGTCDKSKPCKNMYIWRLRMRDE